MTRMFHASYLGVLGHPRSDTVKEAMFRIIDKYSTSENVKFIDPSCYQIVKSSHSPYWIKEARLLVLTDQAIYVMEILDDTMKAKISDKKSNLIPDVILRRRVSLLNIDPTTGEFESIHFSTLADGLMGIMMKPVPRINDPESIPHPNWPNKENVKNCMKTGKAFSMLLWKHRCNASGDIVINDVSELTQCIPDYGYYKPTRVSDDYFGIRSCDQIEDFLLVCDKKTEFLGLLLVEWDRLYGHKDIVYFHKDNTISLRKPVNELTSSQVVSEVYLEMDTSEVNDSNLYGMITSGYIEEYTIWNVLTMKVLHGEVSSGDSLPSYVNDYRKAASRQ